MQVVSGDASNEVALLEVYRPSVVQVWRYDSEVLADSRTLWRRDMPYRVLGLRLLRLAIASILWSVTEERDHRSNP